MKPVDVYRKRSKRKIDVTHELTIREIATILAWNDNHGTANIWPDWHPVVTEDLKAFGLEVFEMIRDDHTPTEEQIDTWEIKLL